MLDHCETGLTTTTRGGSQQLCPHCGMTLEPADIYTDVKGWQFCRKCFRKGKGAIRIDTCKKASFLFEYELPPDPDEFELDAGEKAANTQRYAPAASSYPWARPRNWSARSPEESHDKRLHALATSGAYEPAGVPAALLSPAVLLPALGAGAGAITADDEEGGRLRGALRGLGVGAGAALGHAGASHLSQGDLGARLIGTAAGGTLAYLLARALAG